MFWTNRTNGPSIKAVRVATTSGKIILSIVTLMTTLPTPSVGGYIGVRIVALSPEINPSVIVPYITYGPSIPIRHSRLLASSIVAVTPYPPCTPVIFGVAIAFVTKQVLTNTTSDRHSIIFFILYSLQTIPMSQVYLNILNEDIYKFGNNT